jgi:hypothetical protein
MSRSTRMPRYAFIISAFFSLIFSACGGGGGSTENRGGDSVSGSSCGSTSINASPSSLSFTAVEDSLTVDTKTLEVTFKGAGLLVGYPVGVPPVGWLVVTNYTFSQSPVTLQLSTNAQGSPVKKMEAKSNTSISRLPILWLAVCDLTLLH